MRFCLLIYSAGEYLYHTKAGGEDFIVCIRATRQIVWRILCFVYDNTYPILWMKHSFFPGFDQNKELVVYVKLFTGNLRM